MPPNSKSWREGHCVCTWHKAGHFKYKIYLRKQAYVIYGKWLETAIIVINQSEKFLHSALTSSG